jgi:predicted nucleic acid-binding protein
LTDVSGENDEPTAHVPIVRLRFKENPSETPHHAGSRRHHERLHAGGDTKAAGEPIGSNDLLIAAHAYATGTMIVTTNTNAFKRIRGLSVENWLA